MAIPQGMIPMRRRRERRRERERKGEGKGKGEGEGEGEDAAARADRTLYTPDNLARQRFIASLLGEMGYVICQHLRFHAKARGISPKLFADNKSVQRSVDTLEKKGVLRVEILQFPRKSVLTAKFGCKILVPPDKVVDQDFR